VGAGPRVEVGWEGRVLGRRWPDYIEIFSSNADRPMMRSTVLSGWGKWAGRSCWAATCRGLFVGLCRARGIMAHGKHSSLPCAVPHDAQQRILLIFYVSIKAIFKFSRMYSKSDEPLNSIKKHERLFYK
jgi:hypothetical protein